MEMTFPHSVFTPDSGHRLDHHALLATAIARQANCRTVHLMRQVEAEVLASGNEGEQRLHYFAHNDRQKTPVRGAFWRDTEADPTSEQAVYQAGSINFKVREIKELATGEQFNHAGRGASRTL